MIISIRKNYIRKAFSLAADTMHSAMVLLVGYQSNLIIITLLPEDNSFRQEKKCLSLRHWITSWLLIKINFYQLFRKLHNRFK